jgi:hypothetical protein
LPLNELPWAAIEVKAGGRQANDKSLIARRHTSANALRDHVNMEFDEVAQPDVIAD